MNKISTLLILAASTIALAACTAPGTKTTDINGHKVVEEKTPQDND